MLRNTSLKFLLLIISCSLNQNLKGQSYTDYIGAGNNLNITTSSSSSVNQSTGDRTISGAGLDAKRMEASRFLAQSTLGFDIARLDDLADNDNDFTEWINTQFLQSPTLLEPLVYSITNEIKGLWLDNGENLDDFFGPWALHFNYAFWQANMTSNDVLRQRIALALSEIFVVSINSNLVDHGEGLANYYDILLNNSFGNYKDLLKEVSLHPAMGLYLSHYNNQKTNEAANIHPDENYAREIMQLFSIGLYELNLDGTQKLQGGQPIPTYTNDDITQLAKVFTGLSASGLGDEAWSNDLYFGIDFYQIDKTKPMKMYENFHEQGAKSFLGKTVAAGQTGMKDIDAAIDIIFNHPNVGPFLATRLIQRLVKSNPSKAYVQRVARTFNRNENGVRGDMKSVIKAILLDDEARSCNSINSSSAGKLREPILRLSHAAKSLPLDAPQERYYNSGFEQLNSMKQHPLGAPSVFNFYTPEHAPIGDIADNSMVAPEFKIFDSSSSINYINKANQWFIWESLWWSWESDYGVVNPSLITDELIQLADEPEALINRMDIMYTHGQLTENTKAIIKEAMLGLKWENVNKDRVRLGLYLLFISPDYTILK